MDHIEIEKKKSELELQQLKSEVSLAEKENIFFTEITKKLDSLHQEQEITRRGIEVLVSLSKVKVSEAVTELVETKLKELVPCLQSGKINK